MPKAAALLVSLVLALALGFPAPAAEEELPALAKMRAMAQQEATRGDEKAAAFLQILAGSKDKELGERGGQWLVALAKRGVVEAEFTLGVMLELATPPVYENAFEWHRRAADKGYVPSMTRLAEMYLEGHGVEKDNAKAIDWASRAAEMGDATAQAWLGARYYEGKIVSKDLIASRDWLEKASRQGNAMATLMLVGVLQKTGVPGDDEKATALAKRIAEASKAAASPAKEKEPEDPAARMQRLLAAAKGEDVRAQSMVGYKYLVGDGVEKDLKQAHAWLQKAADKGEASALVNLGTMYANGNGVPRDEKKAARLYKASAEKGNAQAQANLGGYHRRGDAGLKRDEVEAVRLFTLSAEQGNRSGQRQLASMYELGGGGLPKDRQQALEWYRKAAAQGDTLAAAHAKALER